MSKNTLHIEQQFGIKKVPGDQKFRIKRYKKETFNLDYTYENDEQI